MKKMVETWLSLDLFVPKTCLPVSRLAEVMRLATCFQNLVTETTRNVSLTFLSLFSLTGDITRRCHRTLATV